MKIKVTKATSFLQKTKGLLGTDKAYPLLLQTRWGIHTFGMKYPIDVVILDNSSTIMALKPNLQPNRIFLWNPKYNRILELPSGFIGKNKLKPGKKLHLVR